MDNLSELKEIWKTAKTDNLPGSAEMVRTIRKYRNWQLVKLSAVILLAIFLVGVMVWVCFVYKSVMLSTRVGELFMITAGTMLAVVNIIWLLRFYKLKEDYSNLDYLKFLERTRQQQHFYYKRTQGTAMAFCAAGLLLYLYEAVYKDRVYFLAGYGLLIAYLIILWFVVRPKAFRRQDKKIKEKIERIETLIKQL